MCRRIKKDYKEDTCEICPFIDKEKTDKEFVFCIFKQQHFEPSHKCRVKTKTMVDYVKKTYCNKEVIE